jgi:hypothetical protein
MGTSGFDPKTLDDNHELAETCILSITEHGPNAKVAVKSGGFMVEASAAVILAECWHRRIKLEKAAPQGNPGTGGGGRKPTRIERNPEGHRCAICDGTYAHVHGYDGNGEVPGMFDGSDWDGTAPKGAGAGAPMEPGAQGWSKKRPTEAAWYMVRGPGFRICLEAVEIAGMIWPAAPHIDWKAFEGCEFCRVNWPSEMGVQND